MLRLKNLLLREWFYKGYFLQVQQIIMMQAKYKFVREAVKDKKCSYNFTMTYAVCYVKYELLRQGKDIFIPKGSIYS